MESKKKFEFVIVVTVSYKQVGHLQVPPQMQLEIKKSLGQMIKDGKMNKQQFWPNMLNKPNKKNKNKDLKKRLVKI